MSQKIQLRRGTDSERQTVVFDNGEPVWTTDNQRLYIGDGVTSGGIAMGSLEGESYTTVIVSDNEASNGANLIELIWKVNDGVTLPFGEVVHNDNPYTIFIPPGKYNLTGANVYLKRGGLNLVGLGSPENTIVRNTLTGATYGTFGFFNDGSYTDKMMGNCSIRNISILNDVIDPAGSSTSIGTECIDFIAPTSVTLSGFKNITLDNLILSTTGRDVGDIQVHAIRSYCRADGSGIINSTFSNITVNHCNFYCQYSDYDDQGMQGGSVWRNIIVNSTGIALFLGLYDFIDIYDCKFVGKSIFGQADNVGTSAGNQRARCNFYNCDFSGFMIGANSWGGPTTVGAIKGRFYNCKFHGTVMGMQGAYYKGCHFINTGFNVYHSTAGKSGLFDSCIFQNLDTNYPWVISGTAAGTDILTHCTMSYDAFSSYTGSTSAYNIVAPINFDENAI